MMYGLVYRLFVILLLLYLTSCIRAAKDSANTASYSDNKVFIQNSKMQELVTPSSNIEYIDATHSNTMDVRVSQYEDMYRIEENLQIENALYLSALIRTIQYGDKNLSSDDIPETMPNDNTYYIARKMRENNGKIESIKFKEMKETMIKINTRRNAKNDDIMQADILDYNAVSGNTNNILLTVDAKDY